MVLWNLPATDSPEYKYLRELAGPIGGEMLLGSGGEMWLVDSARADSLEHAFDEQGVHIVELGAGYNELVSTVFERVENDKRPAVPGPHSEFMRNAMKSDAVTSVTMMEVKPSPMMEYSLARGVKPMIGRQRAPESADDEIVIHLSATEKVTAKRTYVKQLNLGGVWHGRIVGSDEPVSLMWRPGDKITGSLTYRGKPYMIKHISGTSHAVIAMDPDKMPPEHPVMQMSSRSKSRRPGMDAGVRSVPVTQEPSIKQSRRSMRVENLRNLQDARVGAEKLPEEFAKLLQAPPESSPMSGSVAEPGIISILFVYTKAAARNYGDIYRDLIALAIEQTNQSFRSSKIDTVQIELAGIHATDYDEDGGNLFNHLWHLADRGDGFLEEIHQLRDRKKADVVVLIVDSPTGCGLATRVAAEADEAFAVVHHECATTTYSIAHEIGHLIGARHDRSLDMSGRPFPFGHGFVNKEKWRTMMSYKSGCNGCPRLPIWSSPDVVIGGETAGDAMTHNARVIAEQAARVAAFR